MVAMEQSVVPYLPTHKKPGPKLRTKKQFQVNLDKKGLDYTIIDDYRGLTVPIQFRHNFCGQVITTWPISLLVSDSKCPCEAKKIYRHDIASQQKFIDEHKPDFEIIVFKGTRAAINTYRHNICGKIFQQSEGSFRITKHCPLCAGQFAEKINTIPLVELQQRLDSKFPNEYEIVGNYKRASQPTTIKHKCGHQFIMVPSELLRWQNPICENCNPKTIGRIHSVIIQDWLYKVQCQNEVRTLYKLIEKYGIDHVYSNVPRSLRFMYKFKKIRSSYYPDFYISSLDLIIEVKDLNTFGISKNGFLRLTDQYERNCAKAKAVIKAGYQFKLILYISSTDSKELLLPTNWYVQPRTKILQAIAGQLKGVAANA